MTSFYCVNTVILLNVPVKCAKRPWHTAAACGANNLSCHHKPRLDAIAS